MGRREYQGTFRCVIMTPDKLLYENDVFSVFFLGDQGEYELLPYHYPTLGILKQGNVIVNWEESILVKYGVVKFFANECIILVEEVEREKVQKAKKAEDDIAIDTTQE